MSSLPDGQRLYAIGDIHGRLDLLKALVAKINADAGDVPARKIFLGDYIDRGIYSREVIDYLMALRETEKVPPIFLLGNHEHIMRVLLEERVETLLQSWMYFGGKETLLSYGVNPAIIAAHDVEALFDALADKTPESHKAFLKSLPLSASFGDYFFCHAGVRPGVSLETQSEQDLVWIRDEFLDSDAQHGKIIVHGHSICDEAEILPNRICIDTGAYATGCLTALGLEGTKKWLIQTA